MRQLLRTHLALLIVMATIATSAAKDNEWLTTEEVAEWFRVPVWTVRTWRQRKTGPRGTRVGRHVRYRRSELMRWADANTDPAA